MKNLEERRIWLLGDDIDTDIIIPTQFLAMQTVDEMKQYAFSPLRSELAGLIKPGDIIVAGKNFGCGSSREQAPEVIRALGVSCIIAKSFARIFYRNAFNNGLMLIENNELADRCEEGDLVTIDFHENAIRHKNEKYNMPEIPFELAAILEAGGLVHYMKALNSEGV